MSLQNKIFIKGVGKIGEDIYVSKRSRTLAYYKAAFKGV